MKNKYVIELQDLIDEYMMAEPLYREYEKRKEKIEDELNSMYDEITKKLDTIKNLLTSELTDAIKKLFIDNGIGVRKVDESEVFLGSGDGIRRYQSKVSTSIYYGFYTENPTIIPYRWGIKAEMMLRNEDIRDDVKIKLSNRNTIKFALEKIIEYWNKGFWSLGN